MAVYDDREAFIPYRFNDLIQLCLQDGELPPDDQQTFQDFAHLLSNYYHVKFHHYAREILDNYAAFNPDRDTHAISEPTAAELEAMDERVVEKFRQVLKGANYIELSDEMLQQALNEKPLVDLKTNVDFQDFDRFLCFYRGDIFETVKLKKWVFWTEERELDILQRVVVLIRYKGPKHFEQRNIDLDEMKFIPGKMYVYLYKNVPKSDLELLFPNVQTSMTLKDQLLFGIPAIGAAIPAILRVLPQLLLVVSVILFLTIGPPDIDELQADEEDVQNLLPVLLAVASLTMALGGLAFKQYSQYQNKRIKFQKKVTDTLFFRNIATNASVFSSLINAAQDEECKEVILVYYHLLTHPKPLTPDQLDDEIEQWLDSHFGIQLDFDIKTPLRSLETLRGGPENKPLLSYDEDGHCQVVPLEEAQQIIDWVWDRIFDYANSL
ncbi:DUF3754 domain-containing protein [Phormidium yuhuli AB48]|uniref:DUF3754 domain-containing protein n=1 Tax=Phormidium yuhuli AB48 TaxID=2940671 RepID=A0ABY5AS39_9CYAN|nr:DUF3754 domain-containing protein [Phormidium yuhuli]USR92038.1 DUF3754 domain-containing protein [Phormidium yuhuli AB48]